MLPLSLHSLHQHRHDSSKRSTGLRSAPLSSERDCRIPQEAYLSKESRCSYCRPDLRLRSVRLRRKPLSSRKEVFQPHLPVRLPCYDLAPITGFALGRSLRSRTSGTPGFHGLTGGVYKARERIHRAMADARLLANPASWGRVADPSPNWDAF